MIIFYWFLYVSHRILCIVICFVISEHHIRPSDHLWINRLLLFAFFLIMNFVISGCEVWEGVRTKIDVWFCLTDRPRPINLFVNEVILVVGVIRILIVSENKVFIGVDLFEFGWIILCSKGMFRKSLLRFRDIVGARMRVGYGEVVFPSVGNRLLHLSFILLILLDVLRLYGFGVWDVKTFTLESEGEVSTSEFVDQGFSFFEGCHK